MTSPKMLNKLSSLVLTLCVPLLLIVSPLYFFVSSHYVEMQYRRPDFPAAAHFVPAERARLSRTIVGYLRSWNSLEEMEALRDDDGEIAMKKREVEHIIDVKKVTGAFFRAHLAALALALMTGWFLQKSGHSLELLLALRAGALLALALMASILMSALLDFNRFFSFFHQIFFASGTWIFSAEDMLIQLYPLVFWIDTVKWLTISIGTKALLLLGVTQWRLSAARK